VSDCEGGHMVRCTPQTTSCHRAGHYDWLDGVKIHWILQNGSEQVPIALLDLAQTFKLNQARNVPLSLHAKSDGERAQSVELRLNLASEKPPQRIRRCTEQSHRGKSSNKTVFKVRISGLALPNLCGVPSWDVACPERLSTAKQSNGCPLW